LTLIVLLSSLAAAQTPEPPPAPEVRYEQRTILDFERGLELQGELVKPAISQVSEARREAFASFIRLRSDFDAEIEQSGRWVR
jgi:hypothetical protein